eukprot:g3191.t1
MMSKLMTTAIACCAFVAANAQSPPHLAQAWVAQSTGDGEPGAIGKESYLFCDGKEQSDDCIRAHVFDYGADTCIKYEINRGFHSPYSGTFYVKCDATDCCKEGGAGDGIPEVKEWDIGQSRFSKISYLGKNDTTELNDKVVKDADVWAESFKIPFTKVSVNYTYFITTEGNDTISHRIDYGAPGAQGSILYGDFQVVHDIDSFKSVFQPPAECLKRNVLTCSDKKVQEWNRKHFKHEAARHTKTIAKNTAARMEVVVETKEMYASEVAPTLPKHLQRLSWLYNILDGEKEQDDILISKHAPGGGFVLLPNTTSWDQSNVDDLLALAIVRDRSLHSMRDLRQRHIPLLESLREVCLSTLADKYAVKKSELLVYVHYLPSFFHFHVHISHYKRKHSRDTSRAHLLETIIHNLKIADDYYPSRISIFNGTDFWNLVDDSALPGGYNCTHKISGPEIPSDMPYRMVQIDKNADLNKTETYDKIKNVQNWYAFRPGQNSGGVQYPSEQMHWYVDAEASKPYLLATECVQKSQFPAYKGQIQHGVRDFSGDRTDFVELRLPSGQLGKRNIVPNARPFINLRKKSVELLWESFNDIADGFGLTRNEFVEICQILEKALRRKRSEMKDLSNLLFDELDTDKNELVDALEFLSTVALVSGMEIRDKIYFAFMCYDFDESDALTIDEMTLALKSAVTGLAKFSKDDPPLEVEIERFSEEAFFKAKIAKDKKLPKRKFVEFCEACPEIRSYIMSYDDPPEETSTQLLNESDDFVSDEISKVPERTEIVTSQIDPSRSAWLHVSMEEEKKRTGADDFEYKSWVQKLLPPTNPSPVVHDCPSSSVELEWIYGYQAQQSRKNLLYTADAEILWPAATVAVVQNVDEHRQRFYMDAGERISCVTMHPSGDIFACGTYGSVPEVLVWNSRTMKTLQVHRGFHKRGIRRVAFSPDGMQLLTIGLDPDHSVAVYEWETNRVLFTSSC